MNTVKKVLHFLSTVFFYSIMAVLAVVVVMFIAYFIDKKIGQKNGQPRAPLFGAYVIISESMVPSINVYDAVLTVRTDQSKIKKYDIITFLSKDINTAGTPITHRVVGIVETETGIKYRTKGDHNNTPDFALISPNEVIGKVYLRIPMIGYLQTLLTKPLGWILLIVIPCLLIIGSDVKKLFKITGKKEDNDTKNTSNQDNNIEPEQNITDTMILKIIPEPRPDVVLPTEEKPTSEPEENTNKDDDLII